MLISHFFKFLEVAASLLVLYLEIFTEDIEEGIKCRQIKLKQLYVETEDSACYCGAGQRMKKRKLELKADANERALNQVGWGCS